MGVVITRANKELLFLEQIKRFIAKSKPKRFELFNPRALMAYREI